ncbi:MAG: hypothetical protein KGL10_00875 [Alphaproteobacteria bacterium]|nr:hypothetical protein [Alphaproteobacteria bacterium]MDE2335845.1 hypothetical protein [Alphaproteobacteria bacterium]
MRKFFLAIACVFSVLLAAAPAFAGAASPVLVGRYDGWKVYRFRDSSGPVCFMSAQPRKEEGHYSSRGQVFFFVTHWPGKDGKNVVSLSAGYTYKKDSRVTLAVNGKTFNLFTQGAMAWTQDGKEDAAVVDEIRAGREMAVKGTSDHGTLTSDSYDLSGSTAAYHAMMHACATAAPRHSVARRKKK